MALKRQVIDCELSDGTTLEDARVYWADKAAAERTMVARGLDVSTNSMMLTGLIAWNVAKRTGITSAGWDEFEQTIVDAVLSVEEPDPTPAAAD